MRERRGAHLGRVKVEDLERLEARRSREGDVRLAFLRLAASRWRRRGEVSRRARRGEGDAESQRRTSKMRRRSHLTRSRAVGEEAGQRRSRKR